METLFNDIDFEELYDLNNKSDELNKTLNRCYYGDHDNDDDIYYDIKDIEEYLSILKIEISLSKYLGQIIYYLGKSNDSYDDINEKLNDFEMTNISSANYNDIFKDIYTINMIDNEISQSLTVTLTLKLDDYITIEIMFNNKLYIRTIKLDKNIEPFDNNEDFEINI